MITSTRINIIKMSRRLPVKKFWQKIYDPEWHHESFSFVVQDTTFEPLNFELQPAPSVQAIELQRHVP